MNAPFDFETYIEKGIVRKQTPNKPRAKDIIDEGKRKLNSLKVILKKIGLTDKNSNDILEYCYDIILNLIRANMFMNGFVSSGLGAHEAEISYLRKLKFSEQDIRIINQLRYFRNGIMYYGKRFDKDYAKTVLDFLDKIHPKLLLLCEKEP